jgi:hypothetical protein
MKVGPQPEPDENHLRGPPVVMYGGILNHVLMNDAEQTLFIQDYREQ